MDWGLLEKNNENKFLREEIVYSRKACYVIVSLISDSIELLRGAKLFELFFKWVFNFYINFNYINYIISNYNIDSFQF